MSGELPEWIDEIVSQSKPVKMSTQPKGESIFEIILGKEVAEQLKEWSKQTFFLGTTDMEHPGEPRKGWTVLLQDGDATVWNTGGGVYIEKRLPGGLKMMTRRLTKAEVKEIEKNWPEIGFKED